MGKFSELSYAIKKLSGQGAHSREDVIYRYAVALGARVQLTGLFIVHFMAYVSFTCHETALMEKSSERLQIMGKV